MPAQRSPEPARADSGAGAASGQRERLSREQIECAALAIVDADGLTGLTMRRLGRELGVEAMAIYHYLPNKAALLDAVAARIAEHAYPNPGPDADWRAALRVLATSLRAALLQHPRAMPLMATRPLSPETGMRLVEPVLPLLLEAGFREDRAFLAIQSVGVYTIGHALAQTGGDPAADTDDEPAIGEDSGSSAYYDEWFHVGLDAMVTGLAPRHH